MQFYLAYLELIGRFRAAGLPFCYPQVSAPLEGGRRRGHLRPRAGEQARARRAARSSATTSTSRSRSGSSSSAARTTAARRRSPACSGSCTTWPASGLLVPGSEARLFLPDRIFTHFEKEEDIETLRGKFEDELVRVHEILERATSNSVIVMNESFNSTTLNDALFVGTEVMQRILELGALGVYVTFVDEIASLSEATVSMVSQIVPENPAERTFKVVRKPADGLAYAWAIADKYGLTYERLMERIGA